jgi:hypothetical protein
MSNKAGTALASAARTTTTASGDISNPDGRGVWVVLDLTAFTTAASLTLSIQGKDPASGKYVTLFTSAAVTTVSTNAYVVYPGITETANVDASVPVPKTFRVNVVHGNANSTTYSVGYSTVQ